jgi:hypothetical protein
MAPITTNRINPMTDRLLSELFCAESDGAEAVLAMLSAEEGVVTNVGSSAGLVVTGTTSAEVTTM